MAKGSNVYSKVPLPAEYHFATSEECSGRDQVTKRNKATSFTQIGPEGSPGLNLANPNPKDLSGAMKPGGSF